MPAADSQRPLRVSIDRVGTFTDCVCKIASQDDIVIKILSVDNKNYPDAPAEAIRRVLEKYNGCSIPRGTKLDCKDNGFGWARQWATNALLERKGERTAFMETAGFKDILQIGNQARPNMFDLAIQRPQPLYSDVFEVDERVVLERCNDSNLRDLDLHYPEPLQTVIGTSGQKLHIIQPLDAESTQKYLLRIYDCGFRSVTLAQEIGFEHISLSHQVSQRSRIVPRGNSTLVDGYLTPTIERYLSHFSASFPNLENGHTKLEFMQSDGGLLNVPIIGFDMGGTSTDVSRYDGQFDQIFETTTPAGGGSILSWKDSLMAVGPENASSHPGPACYRKKGPLTVTDANLALGRFLPDHFPSVFGPNEDEPLACDIVLSKFKELTAAVNRDTGKLLTWAEVAQGFLQVANSSMCGPVRQLTEGRRNDAAKHYLASFGGAGGQHACAIAEALGIRRVLIHKHSSILSVYGIGLVDIVNDEERPYGKAFEDSAKDTIYSDLEELSNISRNHTTMSRYSHVEVSQSLFMRYDGSETSLMVQAGNGGDAKQDFINAHHQQFGFTPVPELEALLNPNAKASLPKPTSTKSVYFKSPGWVEAPVYLGCLPVGSTVEGPALVVDNTQTIVVNPNCSVTATKDLLILDFGYEERSVSARLIDPIQLSVFRHRFYGVAEQMGRVLQKVSVSANIKERFDFSCAIFWPDGFLVANAPHVPAIISSMGFAVKSQIQQWSGKLQDGDALLSNSPAFGGVHLPDLTVITPVFDSEGKDIIFWTVSRGHHADVGGIFPGSMPPSWKRLCEEGTVFNSFLLV
ncbi:hypothetical protein N7532_007672 [Penicillium argentinense]|uniref:Uncharacterized protein n=1 Tax=Penicillium argentinense TaxID=1131581 RepID=A0A9W9EVZ1_9EURO|nr:uncharacterized protein N7532_007672 [Penicillium argentinense]KAJ5088988.1 hypothetical protein N7532_007672 [Penicillium argentinense]